MNMRLPAPGIPGLHCSTAAMSKEHHFLDLVYLVYTLVLYHIKRTLFPKTGLLGLHFSVISHQKHVVSWIWSTWFTLSCFVMSFPRPGTPGLHFNALSYKKNFPFLDLVYLVNISVLCHISSMQIPGSGLPGLPGLHFRTKSII